MVTDHLQRNTRVVDSWWRSGYVLFLTRLDHVSRMSMNAKANICMCCIVHCAIVRGVSYTSVASPLTTSTNTFVQDVRAKFRIGANAFVAPPATLWFFDIRWSPPSS